MTLLFRDVPVLVWNPGPSHGLSQVLTSSPQYLVTRRSLRMQRL